jgi:D-alanyl-D-alanine carboxypeptidase
LTQLDGYFEEFGVSPDSLQARGLVRYAQASALELAEVGEDGREHWLTPAAASGWRELKQAAGRADTQIFIVSAYRSIELQAEIIRRKFGSGQSIEDILRVSAFPGYIEHHSGLALDLGSPGFAPLELEFEHSAAFRWLSNYAGGLGFSLSYPPGNACGYQYEPWHWCFSDAAGG